jgi:hypothetical protein
MPLALAGGSLAVPYIIAGMASMVLTNWVYYNARESALLAMVYHTAANTMGLYFHPMLSGPDLARYYWLLAAVNGAIAISLVMLDRRTWLAHKPAAPAPARGEAVPSIS